MQPLAPGSQSEKLQLQQCFPQVTQLTLVIGGLQDLCPHIGTEKENDRIFQETCDVKSFVLQIQSEVHRLNTLRILVDALPSRHPINAEAGVSIISILGSTRTLKSFDNPQTSDQCVFI